MNQSNIDYLYQVFTPATDRPAAASRSERDAAQFGSHLNQAATSVNDEVHKSYRDTRQSAAPSVSNRSNSENDDRRSPAASDNRPVSQNSDSEKDGGSADSSCTTCDDAPVEARGPNKPDADNHDDDDETADNESAADVAAATNVKSSQSSPAESKTQKARIKGEKEAAVEAATGEATDALNTAPTDNNPKDVLVDGSVQAEPVVLATIEGEQNAPTNAEPAKESKETHGKRSGATAPTHDVDGNDGNKVSVTAVGDAASTAKEKVEAAAAVEQQAVTTESSKDGATKRRTNAVKHTTDDDGASRDGKTSSDAPTAKGPANGNSATNAVAAVAVSPSSANTDSAPVAEQARDDEAASTKPVGNKSETLGPLGRSLRSAVEMTRGHKATDTNEAPHVDPARFIGRVARAIHTANERGGALQLRLSPPELGSLKIEMNIKDGVMSANLEADNATARRLLLDHLPALRERLAEQNIRVERFDVNVRQDDTSGHANPQGSNQNSYQQQADHQAQSRRTNPTTRVSESSEPEPTIITARISSTGINLVI